MFDFIFAMFTKYVFIQLRYVLRWLFKYSSLITLSSLVLFNPLPFTLITWAQVAFYPLIRLFEDMQKGQGLMGNGPAGLPSCVICH